MYGFISSQKPMNTATLGANQARSTLVSPIQVKKGRNGRVQLGLLHPEKAIVTVIASHYPPLDFVRFGFFFIK
jgi:hypothetical protein